MDRGMKGAAKDKVYPKTKVVFKTKAHTSNRTGLARQSTQKSAFIKLVQKAEKVIRDIDYAVDPKRYVDMTKQENRIKGKSLSASSPTQSIKTKQPGTGSASVESGAATKARLAAIKQEFVVKDAISAYDMEMRRKAFFKAKRNIKLIMKNRA